MSPRPSNGRIRPTHSITGVLAVGLTVAAFAVIIFLIVGGGQP